MTKPRLLSLARSLEEVLKGDFRVSATRDEVESALYSKVEDVKLAVLREVRIIETREQNLLLDLQS